MVFYQLSVIILYADDIFVYLEHVSRTVAQVLLVVLVSLVVLRGTYGIKYLQGKCNVNEL